MTDRLADDVGRRARRSGRQAPPGDPLRRALARNQEGLDEAALRRDYATIHFPAQRLHRRGDRPHAGANVVLNNGADDGVTTTHVAGGAIRSECRRTA